MFHSLTPQYLCDLIPNDIIRNTNLNLRNSRQIREVQLGTKRYRDSFLPSSIKLWNDLPLDIRQSASLEIFKSTLKNTLLSVDFQPDYLSYGKRLPQICQTQLRLGHSRLNAHLFRFNLVPSPGCNCNAPREDTMHYFFICPRCTEYRLNLLNTVCHLLAPGVNPTLITHLASDILLSYFLKGNPDLPLEFNELIFEAVHLYITQTRRFHY